MEHPGFHGSIMWKKHEVDLKSVRDIDPRCSRQWDPGKILSPARCSEKVTCLVQKNGFKQPSCLAIFSRVVLPVRLSVNLHETNHANKLSNNFPLHTATSQNKIFISFTSIPIFHGQRPPWAELFHIRFHCPQPLRPGTACVEMTNFKRLR